MATNKPACRAKDPSKCRYHGRNEPSTKVNSLTAKIAGVFSGKKTFEAPAINPLASKEVEVKMEVIPRNKRSKSGFTVTAKGNSMEEALDNLEKEIDSLPKTAMKYNSSGYTIQTFYPRSSALGTDVTDKTFAIGEDMGSLKNTFAEDKKRIIEEDTLYRNTVAEMREQGEADTPNGAKTLAVVEAMSAFAYFKGSYADHEVHAAFNSVANQNTSEYTNRGYGIRVYFERNYRTNDLSRARFTLDDPDSRWSAFSQKQVDDVNSKLEEYFQRVDLAAQPKPSK